MPQTVNSIIGAQTTAGAAEETVLLSLNGAAGAASLPVASGAQLIVSGLQVTSQAPSRWRLQQANDGATWFDIALVNHPGAAAPATGANVPTQSYDFATALILNGSSGADVRIRLRVETAGGASFVDATIRSYVQTQPA